MSFEITPMPAIAGPITVNTTQPSQMQKTSEPEPPPAPTPETTTTAPSTEPQITADTSPQDAVRIAAQIRNEKKVRQAARRVEEDRKKLADENRQYEPWKRAAELSRRSKLAAIRELGITYEDLTAEVLNEGVPVPAGTPQPNVEELVQQQIAKFRKEQEDLALKNQQQAYENGIKNLDAEVKREVDSSDKYPLVKESDAYHDVTEYIEKEFYRTGVITPLEAAIAKVEQEIAEGILHLAKIDKIKSQLLPPQEPQRESAIVAQPVQKTTTLTHRASATGQVARPLTSTERRQRAIRVAQGLPPE